MVRDKIVFAFLRSVIGQKKPQPSSQPIRFKTEKRNMIRSPMQAAGFSMKSHWFVEIFSSALHDYLSYKYVVTLNVPTLKLLKSQCIPLVIRSKERQATTSKIPLKRKRLLIVASSHVIKCN